jgi:lysyl-tRNA synthetase class 2
MSTNKDSQKNFHEQRIVDLQQYTLDTGLSVYPNIIHRPTITLQKFRVTFSKLTETGGQVNNDITHIVVGRIIHKRSSGNKLHFYEIEESGYKLQVLANLNLFPDKTHFPRINQVLRPGDHICVIGHPGSSNPKGHAPELSIIPLNIILLSPCLWELPLQDQGLTDIGLRYQKRHLDFIVHSKNRDIFIKRAKTIKMIRHFLDVRNFLEVETPILGLLATGAAATPFKTHHNSLETDMYLRIAPELHLKKLVVGGFPKVYELGRLFRNEAIDTTHNPEFTSCEFYAAFHDYIDLQRITEEMLSFISLMVLDTTNVDVNGTLIHFNGPYHVMPFMDALRDHAGLIIPPGQPIDSDATRQQLQNLLEHYNLECNPKTIPKMLDKLCGEFVEPMCIQPTFITDHPRVMSPLAKQHLVDPELTERFELFVCGKELCNAYTELNDPAEQLMRFQEQASQRASGDSEAQVVDTKFINALEYGLPPTGGWGMGVDRLVMLLTNNDTIREVLTFPYTKE